MTFRCKRRLLRLPALVAPALVATVLLSAGCGGNGAAAPAQSSPATDAAKAFQAKLVSDGYAFLGGVGSCTHLSDSPSQISAGGWTMAQVQALCTAEVRDARQSVSHLLSDLAPGQVPASLASKADVVRALVQANGALLDRDQAAITAGRWSDVIANQAATDQSQYTAARAFKDLANCRGC